MPKKFRVVCPLDESHDKFTAWAMDRVVTTYNNEGIANGSTVHEYRHHVDLYRSPEASDIWVCAVCGSESRVEVPDEG